MELKVTVLFRYANLIHHTKMREKKKMELSMRLSLNLPST